MRGHTGACAGDLAVEAVHDERFETGGRDTEITVFAVQVTQRQVAEERIGVLADAFMRRHEHEVGVQARRLFVEVARAQERDALDAPLVVIGELADLGMAFEALGAVDDRTACLFEALRPGDVVLLVEAGAQLHEDCDLLAVLGGRNQGFAQARLAGHTVEGDAQRDAGVVVRRLVDEVEQGVHGLIWIEEQFVAGEHLLAHGFARAEHGARLRCERGEQELLARRCGELALKGEDEAEVEGHIHGKHRLLGQVQRLADGFDGISAQVAVNGEQHGLQPQTLLEYLLHVLAVVLVLLDSLAVRIEVGVAGDADHGTVLRGVGAEA